MKPFFICLTFALWATTVLSDPSPQGLSISKTFQIHFPRDLKVELVPMPSLGGIWIEAAQNGNNYSIWTSHATPPTLANSTSVKRIWTQGLDATKQLGEQSQDLGCKAIQSYAYRCDRTSTLPSGKFVAESFYWNSKSDLTTVRVQSKISKEDAQRVLAQFQFKIIDRLPAEARRK